MLINKADISQVYGLSRNNKTDRNYRDTTLPLKRVNTKSTTGIKPVPLTGTLKKEEDWGTERFESIYKTSEDDTFYKTHEVLKPVMIEPVIKSSHRKLKLKKFKHLFP